MAGREYVVLKVSVAPRDATPVMFMLHLPDRQGVTDWAYYDAQRFEVVDDTLPSNWAFKAYESSFSFQPASWSRPYFWDHLLNEATPEERRRSWTDYNTERDLILSEAGRPAGDQYTITVRPLPRPT